jgi:hypothetical protein
VEVVDLGWNLMASPVSAEAVCNGVMAMLDRRGSSTRGDGVIAQKILSAIILRLCDRVYGLSTKQAASSNKRILLSYKTSPLRLERGRSGAGSLVVLVSRDLSQYLPPD